MRMDKDNIKNLIHFFLPFLTLINAKNLHNPKKCITFAIEINKKGNNA